MRKLVYISGQISDPNCIRVAENLRRFAEAENLLLREGFAPLNPASDFGAVGFGGTEYEALMERDIALIHAVAATGGANWQLEGWQQSMGAQREYHLCGELRVPCVDESEGIGRLHDVLGDDYGVNVPGWAPDD